MNKYLEKIALNASKARSMAKAVGVIPDHTSAWKYALRKLRKGDGSPLKGSSLTEAKVKLGDLSNNGYQDYVARARKLRLNQEFAGTLHKGKLDPKSVITGEAGQLSVPNTSGNTHLHPMTHKGVLRDHALDNKIGYQRYTDTEYRSKAPHRVSSPTGLIDHAKYTDMLKKDFKGSVSIYSKYTDKLNKLSDKLKAHQSKHLDTFSKEKHSEILNTRNDVLDKKLFHAYQKPGGDMNHISKPGTFGKTETIVAPDVHSVSATKVSGKNNGDFPVARTVYFDHTPRKAK